MSRAIQLASRGRGSVEPNPMVGCVIVRNGKIIGEGWHENFGGPHAEINAICHAKKKGNAIAGADIYVTLEPCSHFGKTPPCVDALIAEKPARVFAAMRDPFPKVAGRGFAKLREADIDVNVGLCETEARELSRPYLKRLATGLPWVIAKWAQSADGKIGLGPRGADDKPKLAAKPRRPIWISSPGSRKRVHQLRARVDAIMVGINTVLADDPLLTARSVKGHRIALRIVIDSNLRLPESCRLVATTRQAPLLVVVRNNLPAAARQKMARLQSSGVQFAKLPSKTSRGAKSSRMNLKPFLATLARDYQITNLLVEGGTTLLDLLFSRKLIDEVMIFSSPRPLPNRNNHPAVLAPKLNPATLKLLRREKSGEDVVLTYLAAKYS